MAAEFISEKIERLKKLDVIYNNWSYWPPLYEGAISDIRGFMTTPDEWHKVQTFIDHENNRFLFELVFYRIVRDNFDKFSNTMIKLLIDNMIKCVDEGHHTTEGRHIYTLAALIIDSDDVLSKPYLGNKWRPIYSY